MLVKRHASDKLRLAIIAAILSSLHTQAFASQAWNCKQIKNEWDCRAPNSIISPNDLTPESASDVDLTIQTDDAASSSITKKSPNTQQSNQDYTDTYISLSDTTSAKPSIPSSPSPDKESPQKEVEQTEIDSKTLDWYPYTAADDNNQVCQGRYISPQIENLAPEKDQGIPSLQQVFISADQSDSELGKSSTLRGNVDIRQGSKSIHSPVAKLNQETGAFSLEDGVTYRQTGLLISGEKAEGNINEEETRLYNTNYVLHEQGIRGKAGVITRKTKDLLHIEKGSVTFCPPGNNSWQISASEITLDSESGFGQAKHAKLKIFDATVFYFPMFYFPIDDRRHSGFLFPSLKLSSDESRVSIPYYFNIAPNIDDTLTTSVYAKRGLLLENETRYLDQNSINRLSTAYINDTELDDSRWAVGLNHNGKYDRFSTVIDYTKISDNDYFSDLGTNLDIDEGDNSHLDQSAKVTYQADTWQSSVLVQKYQTIDDTVTTPYQRLPEIRISGSPLENIDNVSLNYRAVFTKFDRDQTGLTGDETIIGDRLILNPSVNSEYRASWGYIKPSLKLWHASYRLENQGSNIASKQSASVPVVEIDSGLFFDREFSFQDNGYTQTLEPRLYALYVPYVDQTRLPDFDTSELTFTYNSLFRDNRFSGDDRFGDAKQISLGLTSRVISDQGREILSASIGHAFYFNDRRVRIDSSATPLKDDTSDFATSLTWRPNARFRALFDAAFDADTLNNSEMTLDLQYQEDPNHVIGIRHRFTEDTRKQTTLSYLWPMSKNWSSLGLVQYDWLNNNTIDVASGIEYQSCCWKTRLVVRNELVSTNKRENSIALQFILTGLGGVGKSPTSELRNKIKGYEQREYYNANN